MSYWDHRKPVQRERSVDVEAVSRVVVELLDGRGAKSVTLRAVAGCLGIASASLYSRVESVEDLFDLALDRALGEDPEIDRAMARDEAEELVVAYYRHLLRHRWACRMIAQRPPRGPHYLWFSERLCELLLNSGTADPLGRPMRCRTSHSAAPSLHTPRRMSRKSRSTPPSPRTTPGSTGSGARQTPSER